MYSRKFVLLVVFMFVTEAFCSYYIQTVASNEGYNGVMRRLVAKYMSNNQ